MSMHISTYILQECTNIRLILQEKVAQKKKIEKHHAWKTSLAWNFNINKILLTPIVNTSRKTAVLYFLIESFVLKFLLHTEKRIPDIQRYCLKYNIHCFFRYIKYKTTVVTINVLSL